MSFYKNTDKIIESGLNYEAANFVRAAIEAQRKHHINTYETTDDDNFVYAAVTYVMHSKKEDSFYTNCISFDANVKPLCNDLSDKNVFFAIDSVKEHLSKVISSLKDWVSSGNTLHKAEPECPEDVQ